MKLTLVLDGKSTDFYSRGITAGASLTAFDLLEGIDDKAKAGGLYTKEHREELLRFVVELFSGQFTEQQFLEGCADSFFNVVPGMLRAVVAGVQAKAAAFPNAAAGGEPKA